MKLMVGIPAYNEEAGIDSVVLKAKKYADRVLVIDDGSSDRTSEIAEAAGAKVVRHMKNSGYGAALASCFSEARKSKPDALVVIDGDGQHDASEIPLIAKPILDKKADIVIGSRFLSKANGIPLYRKIGIKVLDAFTCAFSQKVSDTQSGFRAYSRKAYSTIYMIEKGMGAGSEILLRAKENNLRIKEVAINVRYDTGEHSKNPLTHGLTVLMTIVRAVSQGRPLFFFGLTGGIMLLGGIYSGWRVYDTYDRSHVLALGTGLVTVIMTIIGIVTVQTGIMLYALEDTIRKTKYR